MFSHGPWPSPRAGVANASGGVSPEPAQTSLRVRKVGDTACVREVAAAP